ncbi:flagellar basal body-associated protein FliL [Azospirillum sp. OGB3]|uniref:flagellar basal body-associated FliL family protein n=1 Tax=Azospirillum sp. OGB3 TaxID=2587012 RepID=UPI0018299853|nr:flagellar basal body-associated FliL family protein [Azospirillum sp. OGB3]MBB3265466.1 flagellar basal body-associated protein FliL [Azospirillum sp. OGB3]
MPVLVAVALVLLAALGTWTVVSGKPGARSGGDRKAQKTYASLPTMTFTLGGSDARQVDIRVLLEIEPTGAPNPATPFVPRIADQMADRLRQIEPSQLSGAEGANLIKSTVASVMKREAQAVRVREVLLERMVVR